MFASSVRVAAQRLDVVAAMVALGQRRLVLHRHFRLLRSVQRL
jgi:hypothetical protein